MCHSNKNEGQSLVEYALILMLVVILVIVILVLLGPATAALYSNFIANF